MSKRVERVGSARRALLASAIAVCTGLGGKAWAAPVGGVVQGGAGTIDQIGNTTSINQTTTRLAIDWDSFDIQVDERVEFIQPGRDALALNRILSNDGTTILGQLTANGHVLLVNPNGVFFGDSARVDVGGLIAAGLNADTGEFMAGELRLDAALGAGAVVNAGIIQAASGGNVALLGESVENRGAIAANLGTVTLAAGRAAVLSFDASGWLGVRVTEAVLQDELGVEAAVLNSGEVLAHAGKVVLTAKASQALFDGAVNHGGFGGATDAVVHEDGSFSLGAADVVNSGSLVVDAVAEGAEPAEIDFATAGSIILEGRRVEHTGLISANSFAYGELPAIEEPESALPAPGTVTLRASERLRVADSAMVRANGVDDLYDTFDRRTEGGTISMSGAAIALEGEARIEAMGVAPYEGQVAGTITIGDACSQEVVVGELVQLTAGGAPANPDDMAYGPGGNIHLFARRHLEVNGALIAAGAGGYDGSAGGSVRLESGGELGFAGFADVSGGGSSMEPESAGAAGTVSFRAPHLIISSESSPTSLRGGSLGNALRGHVELIAGQSIRAVGTEPIVLGRQESFRFEALGTAEAPGTIDLARVSFDLGGPYSLIHSPLYSFEAGGDISAPGVLPPYAPREYPRGVDFVFTSHSGSIVHSQPINSYWGTYRASAGDSIITEGDGRLILAEPGNRTNGSAVLSAGAGIDVVVEAAGSRQWDEGPALVASAPVVTVDAPLGLVEARLSGNTLQLIDAGQASLDAQVTGGSEPAEGALDWYRNGDRSELSATLAPGAHMQVEHRSSLLLNDLLLDGASATITVSGAGARLSQNGGSLISLTDSQLSLGADTLALGAAGTAEVQMFGGGNNLSGDFADRLELNGVINSRAANDYYRFTGSDAANSVEIGPAARIASADNFFGDFRLAGGDDVVTIWAAGDYRFYLGEGADQIISYNGSVYLWAVDLNREEDSIRFRQP